ncbi:MAG: hypothetical protein LKJ86_10325 [Oscillibacter sp.]|jgi:uridine kinase|nr:hypothetical protein [Oscillibacter sp.]
MTTFDTILQDHQERYPLMQPQDYAKLAFQSEFGPEHLVKAEDSQPFFRLMEEWNAVKSDALLPWEPIGNGLCRFHLSAQNCSPAAAALLAALFAHTAQKHSGTSAGLDTRLNAVRALHISDMDSWLDRYAAQGCPPVHHSAEFRQAYQPHYRVIKQTYADYFPALLEIQKLVDLGQPAIVAVDGRCGSGKTTFARLVQCFFPCNVFHMDDFYLPLPRRAKNWEATPCGNMDLDRFLREVLLPARNGNPVSYRAFSCQRKEYLPPENISFQPLTLVEGSYALHPSLSPQYDLRIFLTCSKEAQSRRLQAREGAYFTHFQQRWIPLEEAYFKQFHIRSHASTLLDTTDFE